MSTSDVTPKQPRPKLEKWVKRLSFVAMVGMFIVLMMGSTVTNTGSGEGCGRSWPLCHGEFIPEYAVETAIEFSHRIVTAIEGILIFAVSIGAILIRRGNRQVKVLVAVTGRDARTAVGTGRGGGDVAPIAGHHGQPFRHLHDLLCRDLPADALSLRTAVARWRRGHTQAAASALVPARRLGVARAVGDRGLCRRLHAPFGQRARLLHLAALQRQSLPGIHRSRKGSRFHIASWRSR